MALARGLATVITVSPGTYGGAAYGIDDVVGSVMTLPAACPSTGGRVILESISVSILVASASAPDLDLFFFDRQPVTSVGADNAAFALADADTPRCIGKYRVAASSFAKAGAANSISTSAAIGILLQADVGAIPSATATDARRGVRDLYCVAVTRTAVTLASATASTNPQPLIFKIGFLQE